MAERLYICGWCGQDTTNDNELCRVCAQHQPRHKESKDRRGLPAALTYHMRDTNILDDNEYDD